MFTTRRTGFTLLEVLVAAGILLVALAGITAMGAQVMRKAGTPDHVEKASLLAAERLSYFRSQRRPYQAVGGTYHIAENARYISDPNQPPDGLLVNNVFNDRPFLFLREYLYDTTEGRYGRDEGRASQASRFATAGAVQANAVADTPIVSGGVPVSAIFPNIGVVGAGPALPAAQNIRGYSDAFTAVPAPRANPDIVVGGPDPLPDNIKFVREVWIMTNHPYISNEILFGGAAPPNDLTAWFGAGLNSPSVAPRRTLRAIEDMRATLPPYAVGALVRVFARDPRVGKLSLASAPATATDPPSGLAYDPSRPLAEMAAIFALKRRLIE